MFTLKFRKGDTFVTVAGSRYDFRPFENRNAHTEDDTDSGIGGGIVTVYPGLTSETIGVEFKVTYIGSAIPGNQTFDVCFISNAEGKTIDRIGPFGGMAEQSTVQHAPPVRNERAFRAHS